MLNKIRDLLNKLDSEFVLVCYTPYSEGYLLYFTTVFTDRKTFTDIADVLTMLETLYYYVEFDSFDGEELTVFVSESEESIWR